MDSSAHPDNLINIASGRILPANVNVHDTISIGTQQMKTFEETWPSSFQVTLPKLVLCMSSVKKHVNVGSSKVFYTSLIYSRVIGLQASSRSVDIKSVLSHELAPIPTSMFTDSGVMRVCKTKSDLKRLLQVTSSARNRSSEGMSIIIDGSALLWCIHWPEKGTVEDYIKGVKLVVQQHLKSGNVYLVFDRYKQYSTKDCTRTCRGMSASRIYKLTLSTPLPSRKVVMSATENKKQLIHLICLNFINDTRYNTEFAYKHKLVLTGPEAEPYEFYCGQINQRPDLRTTHEEADTILVQQAIKVAANKQQVLVISDDTDVFLLLMYFYKIKKISSVVLMESPVHGRSVIDIRASAIKHKDILPDILAAHAVSGCDTTAMCYGIGKSKVIKALNSGHSLSMVGDQHANLSDVIKQASKFMVACYGKSLYNSTSEARVKLWADRIGGGRSQLPLLHSLPPTDVAFSENVKRAHLQTCIWKHSMEADPPNLDPLAYGFYKDINSKCLLPITLPENIEVAPPEILNLIKCSCKSTIPCTTKRCGCLSADLPCTMFCSSSTNGCGNALTVLLKWRNLLMNNKMITSTKTRLQTKMILLMIKIILSMFKF